MPVGVEWKRLIMRWLNEVFREKTPGTLCVMNYQSGASIRRERRRVYFTEISCTGSFGSRTRFTGQDWALASLKAAVARMSATEAPKWAV